MVMEQVRGSKSYTLPLDELYTLAPDISWNHTPPFLQTSHL